MITNLRYADNIILLATLETELQELVDRLYNTKFVKRHVAVASEALANRTVKKHRRRKTNVL